MLRLQSSSSVVDFPVSSDYPVLDIVEVNNIKHTKSEYLTSHTHTSHPARTPRWDHQSHVCSPSSSGENQLSHPFVAETPEIYNFHITVIWEKHMKQNVAYCQNIVLHVSYMSPLHFLIFSGNSLSLNVKHQYVTFFCLHYLVLSHLEDKTVLSIACCMQIISPSLFFGSCKSSPSSPLRQWPGHSTLTWTRSPQKVCKHHSCCTVVVYLHTRLDHSLNKKRKKSWISHVIDGWMFTVGNYY